MAGGARSLIDDQIVQRLVIWHKRPGFAGQVGPVSCWNGEKICPRAITPVERHSVKASICKLGQPLRHLARLPSHGRAVQLGLKGADVLYPLGRQPVTAGVGVTGGEFIFLQPEQQAAAGLVQQRKSLCIE